VLWRLGALSSCIDPIYGKLQYFLFSGCPLLSALFDTTLQKVAFIHGVAPWLRSLEHETTFDGNIRVSAFRKSSVSDNDRITLEIASDQASFVMFISTCGDVFKTSLSKDHGAAFDSVPVENIAFDERSFPMFQFNSEHFKLTERRYTSTVSIVVFAGANECYSGTRLVDECFDTCRNALSYVFAQLDLQQPTGGFHALQSFCDSFRIDDCIQHRICAAMNQKSAICLKPTVQLPLTLSFYEFPVAIFSEIAAIWISAKRDLQTYMLDSKLSLDCMPHPVSLDALIKSLSEHASGFSGKKKATGMVLNVLADTSNKQLNGPKQDSRGSSHTMIRRKSTVSIPFAAKPAPPAAFGHRKSTVVLKRASISMGAGGGFPDMKQATSTTHQKQIITSHARASIELTKGLTNTNAPKTRILKEQKCMLMDFGLVSASYLQEISSVAVSASQNFMVLTIGTCMHFVQVQIEKRLQTKSMGHKNMSANLCILQSCETADTMFLILSNGRLACLRRIVGEVGEEVICIEIETYIGCCNLCSIYVQNEWLNICGSEGSQNIDYVRFKLENDCVVENSGHGVPLQLSTSVTAIRLHSFDPKALCPLILCGLCNSEVEVWGKTTGEDVHPMQSLRNRTSGLGAVNSICIMGQDTVAIGHDGGYVHIWSIKTSSNSTSCLDRQYWISPSSVGLPRSFHNVSADTFAEDNHSRNSQVFVINEQNVESVIMHAETGVSLHRFSLPNLPSFPPHILQKASGQYSEIVTIVELSVLCIQGPYLHHETTQLQFIISKQSSHLVANLGSRRKMSQVDAAVRPFSNHVSESTHDELSVSGMTSAQRDSKALALNDQFEPGAPDDEVDVCSPSIAFVDKLCESETQKKSTVQAKASCIMNQILSRRYCHDSATRGVGSPKIDLLDDTSSEKDPVITSTWRIVRPLIPLPTKFDLERTSHELEPGEHSGAPHHHHDNHIAQTSFNSESQENDDETSHGLWLTPLSPHLMPVEAILRSKLPKKMSSQLQSPIDLHKPNHTGLKTPIGSKMPTYDVKKNEDTVEFRNEQRQGRRPNPLLFIDEAASSARFGDLKPSLAASSSQHDSISDEKPLRAHPLLAKEQFTSSSAKELNAVRSRSGIGRLPKRLQ
jgi:hypothetical protein